ncbi:glycosyltransferase [Cryobacterium arcticum]|uniref:Glycosyltransferase GtfC n=1 Tax=Cryobacterium arcticum TaxID=670052 RepID=A0A1B1BFV9_9MICO|nr:glycosyltransferase [Cryobacterium arcticum]ANP71454.1 Glycosyltransferase GtfC [Cryobacterium arcticum]
MTITAVSVVTIAWNNLDGLKLTVSSVLEQDYANIELIVVDGGSTDGTAEYLKTLPRSVHWVSEPDKGRYDAMNKGAQLSTGQLLWFMHSGDCFGSKSSVSTVVDSWLPTTRWGFGLSRVMSGQRVVGIFGSVRFSLRRFALGGRPISHQAAVISRSLHDTIGGYDIKFGLAADQYYLLKAAILSPPQIWCEFLCNFDNSGAGSVRPAVEHYRDMTKGRRLAGFVSTRSAYLDTLIASAFAVRASIQRRVTQRLAQ